MKKMIGMLAAAAMLWPAMSHAHMPNTCLSQMHRMNMWVAPKKADAARMAETGKRLTALGSGLID